MIFRAVLDIRGYTSILFSCTSSSILVRRISVCSLNVVWNPFRILKWKAGVKSLRRCCHLSPTKFSININHIYKVKYTHHISKSSKWRPHISAYKMWCFVICRCENQSLFTKIKYFNFFLKYKHGSVRWADITILMIDHYNI